MADTNELDTARLRNQLLMKELECEKKINAQIIELVKLIFSHPSVTVSTTKAQTYTDENGLTKVASPYNTETKTIVEGKENG